MNESVMKEHIRRLGFGEVKSFILSVASTYSSADASNYTSCIEEIAKKERSYHFVTDRGQIGEIKFKVDDLIEYDVLSVESSKRVHIQFSQYKGEIDSYEEAVLKCLLRYPDGNLQVIMGRGKDAIKEILEFIKSINGSIKV